MFKKFILNYFFPQKNILYFDIYITFWKEIVFKKKWTNILTIKIFILLSFFQFFKYAFIEFVNPSTISRIVLYDGITLILPNRHGLGLMAAAICLMIIRLLKLCYFKGEKNSFLVLEKMLFKNNAKILIWPNYKGQNACKYLINFANKALFFGPVLAFINCK